MNTAIGLHGLEQLHRSDVAHTMHGVPGRFTHRTTKPGRPCNLWFNQLWVSNWRLIGTAERMRVEVRFDDHCGNGHNTLSICGYGERLERGRWVDSFGGQCTDEMREHFPELARLLPWHLCSTDGPMHYIANT